MKNVSLKDECKDNAPLTTECIKWKSYSYGVGGSERNILHVTNGKKKKLGYHYPTVSMANQNKMRVFLPKSDEWDYKVDSNL